MWWCSDPGTSIQGPCCHLHLARGKGKNVEIWKRHSSLLLQSHWQELVTWPYLDAERNWDMSLPGQPLVSSNHKLARGAWISWTIKYFGIGHLLRGAFPDHPIQSVPSITIHWVSLFDFLHSALYPLVYCLYPILEGKLSEGGNLD